jgi:hypothetical protein
MSGKVPGIPGNHSQLASALHGVLDEGIPPTVATKFLALHALVRNITRLCCV